MNKDRFLDSRGRMVTQAMFLEVGYNTEYAIYTLGEYDKEYEGKTYPSLKALYLDEYDPTEYNFVQKNLYSWEQWQRLLKNAIVRKHIDKWREELEIKMRSDAVKEIVSMSLSDKGFQAAKFLAEKGWDKKGAGRPKKDTSERDERVERHLDEDFKSDAARVLPFKGK